MFASACSSSRKCSRSCEVATPYRWVSCCRPPRPRPPVPTPDRPPPTPLQPTRPRRALLASLWNEAGEERLGTTQRTSVRQLSSATGRRCRSCSRRRCRQRSKPRARRCVSTWGLAEAGHQPSRSPVARGSRGRTDLQCHLIVSGPKWD